MAPEQRDIRTVAVALLANREDAMRLDSNELKGQASPMEGYDVATYSRDGAGTQSLQRRLSVKQSTESLRKLTSWRRTPLWNRLEPGLRDAGSLSSHRKFGNLLRELLNRPKRFRNLQATHNIECMQPVHWSRMAFLQHLKLLNPQHSSPRFWTGCRRQDKGESISRVPSMWVERGARGRRDICCSGGLCREPVNANLCSRHAAPQ